MRQGLQLLFMSCFMLIVVPAIAGAAWPVNGTGQTSCYGAEGEIVCPGIGEDFYGQDGILRSGPLSFTRLDDQGKAVESHGREWAMVRDNVTGLTWEVKKGGNRTHTYAWTEALDYADRLDLGGYHDWRLPTVKELLSIVNYGNLGPASFEDYFPNLESSLYLTATLSEADPADAWTVCFERGAARTASRSGRYHLVAVRSDSWPLFGDLVDNGDGTVTDADSGLMWQQETGQAVDWREALSHAENLELAGFSDWRLPTVKELQSAVDYHAADPAVASEVFHGTAPHPYWSSTTDSGDPWKAWIVDFTSGAVETAEKGEGMNVRAVRGGQVIRSAAAAGGVVLLESSGSLVINSPSPGSRWEVGDAMSITWSGFEPGGTVSIAISRDGGQSFQTIADAVGDTGRYNWTVTGPDAVNCVIRVAPTDDFDRRGESGMFTIRTHRINVEARCFVDTIMKGR